MLEGTRKENKVNESNYNISDYTYKFIDHKFSNYIKNLEIHFAIFFESLEDLLDFYFDQYDNAIASMD